MDLESTRLQLEDELEAKTELQKVLIKVQEDARHLRERFDKEIESKNEEIEDQRFDSFFPSKTNSSSFLISLSDVNLTYVSMRFKNN